MRRDKDREILNAEQGLSDEDISARPVPSDVFVRHGQAIAECS
jgi:hypothetical protein